MEHLTGKQIKARSELNVGGALNERGTTEEGGGGFINGIGSLGGTVEGALAQYLVMP